MRSRRSISDIVAVVLLIVIAIAAAVIIYMWLSGLIGTIHTSTSITQVKLEITGANVTYIRHRNKLDSTLLHMFTTRQEAPQPL